MALYGSFKYGEAKYGYMPAPPRNVRLFRGDRWIRIEWDPNPSPFVDEYVVERKEEGGDWIQVGTVPSSETSFTDEDVNNGAGYTYRVRAADDTINNT